MEVVIKLHLALLVLVALAAAVLVTQEAQVLVVQAIRRQHLQAKEIMAGQAQALLRMEGVVAVVLVLRVARNQVLLQALAAMELHLLLLVLL